MWKMIFAASLALSAALPAITAAQAPAPSPVTGNIALVSDYRFRGISQTFERPALQGGFDYSHASGLYVGNWNSNVNEGAGYPAGNLEMDFYGGWKKAFGDFGLDIGAIYYYYPGTDANSTRGTTFVNPRDATKTFSGTVDNKEVYIGGSWKWLSAKWYYSLGDYFSLPDTKGTHYLDLSATYDLGNGWGVLGHAGRLNLRGWDAGTDATKGDYTDWKIGVTKDVGGWVFGAAYVDTNAKGSCSAANPGFYCFPNDLPSPAVGTAGIKYKDAGSGTVVLSVSKTF
jgi:uncharacterized protein (TIGR02001 family)